VIKGGFVPVVLFAGLLGLATVLHWDVFSHQHVTFWIWATLYFTTPFLVFGAWLANRRTAAVPAAEELRLSRPARWVVGVIGFLALVQGLVMFLAPGLVAPFWPWSVTALSCQVIGAMFCLGVAGLVVLTDPRWRTIKLFAPSRNDHGDADAVRGIPRRARVRSPQRVDLASWRRFRRDPCRLDLPLGGHDRSRAQKLSTRPAGSVGRCQAALTPKLSAIRESVSAQRHNVLSWRKPVPTPRGLDRTLARRLCADRVQFQALRSDSSSACRAP